MRHLAGILAAGTVSAVTVNLWISIVAGALAIVLAVRQLQKLWQRRRRLPSVPVPPAPLPLGRVSREDYARMLREWEIYGAQIEQYFKDQKDSQ